MFSNMSALDEILKKNNNDQINEDSMQGFDDVDKYLEENRQAHVYTHEPKKLLSNEEPDFFEKYAIQNEAVLTSNAEEIEDIKTGIAPNVDYKIFMEADGNIIYYYRYLKS